MQNPSFYDILQFNALREGIVVFSVFYKTTSLLSNELKISFLYVSVVVASF